jgi:hypothetical protein
LEAVAGLEMSAVAKNTKGGHKGVVANILREKTGIFFKAYGNNNLNLFLGFVAKSSVTTVEFFFFNFTKIHNTFAASICRQYI